MPCDYHFNQLLKKKKKKLAGKSFITNLITGKITGSNSITGQRWSCPLSTTKNAKRGDDILPKNRHFTFTTLG
jgi:hypothetical protein